MLTGRKWERRLEVAAAAGPVAFFAGWAIAKVAQPGAVSCATMRLGSPVITAWELAQAWPGAELVVVGDSGRTGSDTMEHAPEVAADRLFTTISR